MKNVYYKTQLINLDDFSLKKKLELFIKLNLNCR